MSTAVRDLLDPWSPGCLERAAGALRGLPPPAVAEELTALARADEPSLRADALLLAGELAPDLGDELALALLADPAGFVRWHACERLLFHWCYRAAGPLARLLARELDELVRNMAACALGHLGDAPHLPALAAAWEAETGADHEGRPIRTAIARAMAAIRVRHPAAGGPGVGPGGGSAAEPGGAPDTGHGIG